MGDGMSSADSRPTVVVAEDDPAARRLLVRQLQKAGYNVVACEDGREALEQIQRASPCVAIADWMMPEMDGLELCRSLRSLQQLGVMGFVYFILLTAHSEKEQIVAGLEAGADDYLTKPYHVRELLARLNAGQRIVALQEELLRRQIELHRVNAEMAKLNARLEELANTDVLTRLANRRHLLEQLESLWATADRHQRPLSVIMFDVDRFKRVNDTWGHAAGDEVLRVVARLARRALRRGDRIGRIGGEEFCVVCPETNVEGAAVLAERIRSAVEQTPVQVTEQTIHVTVSLGVAERSDRHECEDQLLADADAALYRAKENGRNQVWVVDREGQMRRYQPEPAGHS